MENCKFCHGSMEADSTICPACGRDNAEALEETVTETAPGAPEVPEQEIPQTEAVPAEDIREEAAPAQVPAEEETARIKEGAKATPRNMALLIGGIIVVVAVIIALLASILGGTEHQEQAADTQPSAAAVEATVPADGNPDDETCKGSYTGSDADVIASGDTVVATAGEYTLTNSELQVYYWLGIHSFLQDCNYYSTMYGFDYAAAIGLNYAQPLDTQICGLAQNGATWQQFFLLNALESWHFYQALEAEAIQAGFDVTAEKREFLDNLVTTVEQDAVSNGFENAEAYLAFNAGPGATMENYLRFMEKNYRGYDYFQSLVDAIELTDDQIETYFDENAQIFAQQGITKDARLVDVRHILLMPAADESGAVTDEAWAGSEAEAQKILEEWKSGEATEDSFAQLANTHTQDGNDVNYDGVPDGGLYTEVFKGQMVPEFEAWCFDETRQPGDTGLVKTTYGWHVMYFVQSYPSEQWKNAARESLLGEQSEELMDSIAGKYPVEVDYSKILLGYLDMTA